MREHEGHVTLKSADFDQFYNGGAAGDQGADGGLTGQRADGQNLFAAHEKHENSAHDLYAHKQVLKTPHKEPIEIITYYRTTAS